jgi:CHAT domain-containing protein
MSPSDLARPVALSFALAIFAGWLGSGIKISGLTLMSILNGCRLVEGRLSNLPYGSTPKLAPKAFLTPESTALLRRFGRQKHAGLEMQYSMFLANLLLGNTSKAISVLQAHSSGGSTGAEVQCDLSVAYLAQYRARAKPSDLLTAFSLAFTPVTLRSTNSSLAIRFNRALVLEYLHLTRSAELAWKSYLQADASLPWTREVQLRLQRIQVFSEVPEKDPDLTEKLVNGDSGTVERFVNDQPYSARYLFEDELLGRWARASKKKNKAEADRLLLLMERMGQAFRIVREDAGAQDLSAAIKNVTHDGLAPLIAGHLSFQEGVDSEKSDSFADAYEFYRRAALQLSAAGSPYARWAILRQGVCAYYLARYEESLALLRSALTGAEPRRYPSLFGRSLWMQGVVNFVKGNQIEALENHRESLRYFARLRDTAAVGFLHSLVAADLRDLGRRELAWTHRLKALSLLHHLTDARRVYSVLWEAAEAAYSEARPRLALQILDELLLRISERSLPGVVAESYIRRSALRAALGDETGALADLKAGAASARAVGDAELRRRVNADLGAAEARFYTRINPARALECFGKALSYYEAAGYLVDSANIRMERATILSRSGRLGEAVADLEYGIREFERKYTDLSGARNRLQYIGEARDLIEEMIQLQVGSLHNPSAGNRYAEMLRVLDRRAIISRVRSSKGIEVQNEKSDSPLIVSALDGLPDDLRIVSYALAGKDLLVWVASSQATHFVAIRNIRKELNNAIGNIISMRAMTPRVIYSQLYKQLIEPIDHYFGSASVILFIPDDILAAVPFAALYDDKRSRFLVEEHAVAVAPSIRVATELLTRAKLRGWPKSPVALILANPSIDRVRYPNLPSLSAADREGKNIARLYRSAYVSRGAEATKTKFEQLAPKSNIIHLAVHSVLEPSSYGSALLFASEREQYESLLTHEDISHLDLSGIRIVVAASCESGSFARGWREGDMSLGWSFLEAGSPSVLVSLWEIDDSVGSEFLTSFHAELLKRESPIQALRSVQMAFLRRSLDGKENPLNWATFELIGY